MDIVGNELSESEREAIKTAVWKRVDALPQRDQIQDSDARQWVNSVVHLHGEQAIWHAIRLNGFGGSEIGVLVRNQHSIRADHQASAHDIVLGKLMRKVPDETNEHMTRGHDNEPIHAQKFYLKYGAHRDEAAYAKLSSAQGKLPWMRYSPDEVAMVPSKLLAHTRGVAAARPMSRILADYKAPSKVEDGQEIHFQYGCQLAQGAILCEEQGIEIHGLMLSQFDWSGWCLKDDVIVADEQLKDLVRAAGNWAWDMVMRGEVPRYVRTPLLEGSDGFAVKNADLARAVAALSALSSAADDHAKELKTLLIERLGAQRFAGHKIVFSGAGALSAVQKVDAEALAKVLSDEQFAAVQETGKTFDAKKMETALRASGVEMKQFRALRVDADKVAEKADEFGIDPESFVAEEVRFTTDKGVKFEMERYIQDSYPTDVVARQAGEPDGPEEQLLVIEDQPGELELEVLAQAPRG